MPDETRTTCPYCGVGCGLIISQTRDGWAVGGDPDHPANRGRICSKGAALIDTITAEEKSDFRLLTPEIDGIPVSWDHATAETARRLRDTIERHGPKSVAFYVSGQLLTEDYYIANKLIKGFIGSPHIDTNSRLCMASTVVGHKRAFGADVVPGCYDDLELADLVVLAGSNLAWCHPVLNQRLRAAREKNGTRIVVIDPRRTASCDIADLHLPLLPGSDVALFNGLLAWLHQNGHTNGDYIARHVNGSNDAITAALADCPDIAATAGKCGLPADDVARFFDWFAATPRSVTVFSQGINQSSQGSDKVNAIINTHLATGRVGKPGSTPFSVTGQPNAMGGREVGGLANQLAAHMDPNNVNDVDRLRRFWKSDALQPGEGHKAIDLFRAVETGEIRAIWIMATNPAVSMPDADRVRLALARCPLVIVSDTVRDTDTMRHAHIRLPAAGWAEKSGTVTNSERRISRQRAFRPLQGQSRPDWQIMCDVARQMGYEKAFRFTDPAQIFAEHAALSAFENDGQRAFDIGAWQKSKKPAYDAMEPFQWPSIARPAQTRRLLGGAFGNKSAARNGEKPETAQIDQSPSAATTTAPQSGAPGQSTRLYGDGVFTTPDGRARMIAVRHRMPQSTPDATYPLIANSGRYRDQWHTMTRTGVAARLSAHRPEPLLEIHGDDAHRFGLRDGGLARVQSAQGSTILRVAISDGQIPGQVFVPMHWNDVYSSAGGIGRMVASHADPLSGQPESKFFPVRVAPFAATWQGILFTRNTPDLASLPYWVARSGPGCMIYEIAGTGPCLFKSLLPGDGAPMPMGANETSPSGQTIEYIDARKGVHRYARIENGGLSAALFVGPERPAIGHDWIAGLLDRPTVNDSERMALLAGRMPDARQTSDRLICSCFSVGLAAITDAIITGRAVTAAEIGRLLQAGTGCGSCLPEINQLLAETRTAQTATTTTAQQAAE